MLMQSYLSADKQSEVAARRVNNFAKNLSELQASKDTYNADAAALREWIVKKTDELNNMEAGNTIEEVQAKQEAVREYKKSEKPEKTKTKLSLENRFRDIQVSNDVCNCIIHSNKRV